MLYTNLWLIAFCCSALAAKYAPPNGEVMFNLGQNYMDEWTSFANGIKPAAGISVYGDIYSGALNPDSQNMLSQWAQSNSGIVEVGMSWKDAMENYGYTQFQGAQLCHNIANGQYDASLQRLATYLNGFPNAKYLFRVDYEVSRNLHANTNPTQFDPSTYDLTAYPAAFRHVRQVISSIAPNVDFVYHAVRGEAQYIYPGDDVVDWNGFSIFNNDVCLPDGSIVGCSSGIIDPNLQKDLFWAPKPKLVAESAVQMYPNSQFFINYLTLTRNIVEDYGFSAWTYINSDWTTHGWPSDQWSDSRIEANSDVKNWFMGEIANDPKYCFSGCLGANPSPAPAAPSSAPAPSSPAPANPSPAPAAPSPAAPSPAAPAPSNPSPASPCSPSN